MILCCSAVNCVQSANALIQTNGEAKRKADKR